MKINDLTGQKFGLLEAIKIVGKAKDRHNKWLCKCKCGNYTIVNSNSLKCNNVLSCGCYKRKRTSEVRSKHHLTNSKLHKIWTGIKQRCFNRNNKSYKFYGERNIKMCKEWNDDFCKFMEWAINNGYKDGLSIERINVNGNYEPSNCKWIPRNEQYLNTRKVQIIEYNGEKNTINYFSNKYDIAHSTFRRYLKQGMKIEEIIKLKRRKNNE